MSAARRLALVGVLVATIALGLAIGLFVSRRSQIETRRDAYALWPPVPGATLIESEPYRFPNDGWPTWEHGLRVTYRLPDSARSTDVLASLRENLPPGWTEASDATCAAMLARAVPPPTVTTPAGEQIELSRPPDPDDMVLLSRASRLTAFAPGETGAADGQVDGVTFTLDRRGDVRLLVLDEPLLECGPPTPDREAAAFDGE